MPHLLYPPTPLYATAKSNMRKMQAIINKTLRWVNGDIPPYNTTIEALHQQYQLTPLNSRLFMLNAKLWEKIETLYPVMYDNLKNNRLGSHKWWPSSLIHENTPPPAPIYKYERREQRIFNERNDEEAD